MKEEKQQPKLTKEIADALIANHQYAPLWLAFAASIIWVLFLWWIIADLSPQAAWNRFHHLRAMEPNEIGDFLAGAFAPIAAIWLVATVFLQFRANRSTETHFEQQQITQRKAEKREVKRRETAARLRLPHVLLELSDYWETCFRFWRDGSVAIPSAPDALRELIALAADIPDPTFESVQKLISATQVFQSRMNTAHANTNVASRPTWLMMMISDLMRLSYLTRRLFGYGRFSEDSVPYIDPTREQLSELLQLISLRDETVLSVTVVDRFEAALPDK